MSELTTEVVDQLRFIEETIRLQPEPPGSPAYVRRLRDQAAVALRTMPPDRDGLFYENDHAVAEANALMATLGYPVPEDTP